jgi:hypothetical protein
LVADLNEKSIVLGTALTAPNGNEIVGRTLCSGCCPTNSRLFKLCVGSLQRRVQMVYDFSEKSRFSQDLIEKI